jgi:hypothetical protein
VSEIPEFDVIYPVTHIEGQPQYPSLAWYLARCAELGIVRVEQGTKEFVAYVQVKEKK